MPRGGHSRGSTADGVRRGIVRTSRDRGAGRGAGIGRAEAGLKLSKEVVLGLSLLGMIGLDRLDLPDDVS